MDANPLFGFAGTGSIGQRHIQNVLQCEPKAQFMFFRQSGQKDELSDRLNAKVVTSMAEVVESQPHAFFISTPSAVHHETLLVAVHARIPVYIEKPAVTDEAHLNALFQLLKDGNTAPSLVGCNLRFLPSLQKMRSLIQDGTIGTVIHARFEAGQWLPDWRPTQDHRQSYSADPNAGGGVIFDLLHELDMAEWMCGPLSVTAAAARKVPKLDIQSEAAANIMLRGSKSDVIATVLVDYVARKPVRDYRVVGDGGSLHWSLADRSLTLETDKGEQIVDCGDAAFDMQSTYVLAVQDLLKAIRTSQPTQNPLESGLQSCLLAIAAKEKLC